jgi:hypothetical protein
MNIGSFFVADSKATKLIQPGKGSLHYPSPATKAAAMLGVTHHEKRHDTAHSQSRGLRARRNPGRLTHNLGDCAAVP